MTPAFTVVELPTQSDLELDALYSYLLGKHREALGENKVMYHNAIMAIVHEWSRRLDQWLADLPPVVVRS